VDVSIEQLRENLRRYYGEVLSSSKDLATNACCVGGAPPDFVLDALARVDARVQERFYGCGWPISQALRGATVVDLGCGTGRDVYVLSQLVGPDGFVHGVDMTANQLAVGQQTLVSHMERFGYERANVAFHQDFIEEAAAVPDGSADVIVSNCVVNLSPMKDRVLANCARMLRPGGEVYLSDVFADRRLDPELAADPLLHAECLGGASYLHDFLDLARATGFADPRIVKRAPITIQNPAIQRRVGGARFESVTLRLLLLPELERRCEDYGQVATYAGGMDEAPALFWLDDHHCFEAGRPERVCGNTADMLTKTRFARWFEVTPRRWHMGEFPCGPTMASNLHAPASGGGGACC
jgi:arsenite methyltransferase